MLDAPVAPCPESAAEVGAAHHEAKLIAATVTAADKRARRTIMGTPPRLNPADESAGAECAIGAARAAPVSAP